MALVPKYALFESVQSTTNWTAFSFTSVVFASTCSIRIFSAMRLASTQLVQLMPSAVKNSGMFSGGWMGVSVLDPKNQLSIMASASATAAMPEMWEPFFPSLIARM